MAKINFSNTKKESISNEMAASKLWKSTTFTTTKADSTIVDQLQEVVRIILKPLLEFYKNFCNFGMVFRLFHSCGTPGTA